MQTMSMHLLQPRVHVVGMVKLNDTRKAYNKQRGVKKVWLLREHRVVTLSACWLSDKALSSLLTSQGQKAGTRLCRQTDNLQAERTVQGKGRAGQGRAGQGRAGQGRAGQGRAGHPQAGARQS